MSPPKMRDLSKFAQALLDPEAKDPSKLGKELEDKIAVDFDEEFMYYFIYFVWQSISSSQHQMQLQDKYSVGCYFPNLIKILCYTVVGSHTLN